MADGAPQPVVVVGGGVSGLRAALSLLEAGRRVVLVERRPGLGGMAGGFETDDGWRLDRYYHYFCGSDREAPRVARALLPPGAGIRWRAAPVGILVDGRTAPFSTPLDILRFAAIPARDRLRTCAHLAWSAALRDPSSLDRVSAEDWLSAWLGPRAYRAIWRPLLHRKFGPHAPSVSAAWIWARIHRMSAPTEGRPVWRRTYGTIEGGAHRLVAALAERVERLGGELRRATALTGIELDGRAVAAVTLGRDRLAHPAAVLSTIPLPALTALLRRPTPPETPGWPPAIDYLPVTVLVLLLDRSLSPYFWLNTNDPEFRCAGVIENTHLDPHPLRHGRHVLYVPFYAGPVVAESWTPDRLLDYVLPDLRRIHPAFDPRWCRERHVFTDRFGQSVCRVGLPPPDRSGRTPYRNLFVTDSHMLHPHDRTLDGSLAMGARVAESLVRALPPRT